MAWDTERTRALLLESATTEFSARGCAGARIDAIARGAGVNKERIYQYFGNKDGLFSAVLLTELSGLMDKARITGTGPDAAAQFATRLYDSYARRPALARLLAWEGLERGEAVAADTRRLACQSKVDHLHAALPECSREQAAQLLLAILALVTSRWTLVQLTGLITPEMTARQHRDAIIALVHQAARG
ncbi:MAG: TetR/AcrR family transcriptional regulator [Mycetocola sp.]